MTQFKNGAVEWTINRDGSVHQISHALDAVLKRCLATPVLPPQARQVYDHLRSQAHDRSLLVMHLWKVMARAEAKKAIKLVYSSVSKKQLTYQIESNSGRG